MTFHSSLFSGERFYAWEIPFCKSSLSFAVQAY